MTPSPLLTDLYQLTMMAAYIDSGKEKDRSTFDLFVRRLPKDWGYLVAAGVDEAVDIATNLKFSEDDISYLRSTEIFKEHHLEYFRNFKFSGEISAIAEGTALTAGTPLVRVTADRAQAQLLESILLNTIGYQTMVASKASRVVEAAQGRDVIDFGMRRAHGHEAAMYASRAAQIAGCTATSNVYVGKMYGTPIGGTMAHSFVMAFPDELTAFRAFVKTYTDKPTLLVDTYNTKRGVANAIIVAKELAQQGGRLGAIRLDSGDLEALAKEARADLDKAGLYDVKIVASGDLNEYKVKRLIESGAPIDAFGVGTEMLTGKPDAALSIVYKLAEDPAGGKLKLAEGKRTWPGKKQVWRIASEPDIAQPTRSLYDLLALESEGMPTAEPCTFATPLLTQVVRGGWRITPASTLSEARKRCASQRELLPASSYREMVATPYELRQSQGLVDLTTALAAEHENGHELTAQERFERTIKAWKEGTV